MTPFKIHILGCGSALPTLRHNPSSQIVETGGRFFMIDCGEGTQLALRRTGINFNKIGAVFISHLHGDHCLGLVGLVSSFGLLGRTAPLHIYAPKEIRGILPAELDFFTHDLGFDVVLHDVDTETRKTVYEDRCLTIESLPLEHRMPTCGYFFREKEGKRHVDRAATDFYGIPPYRLRGIREGEDWVDPEGNVVPNARLTTPADAPRSYAYCSDTRHIPSLAGEIRGVNVLYHEATYGEDSAARAEKYAHSTAAQAAAVARDAGAGVLLIGHYSQRYDDESVLLDEARAVFPRTELTFEGMVWDVK